MAQMTQVLLAGGKDLGFCSECDGNQSQWSGLLVEQLAI